MKQNDIYRPPAKPQKSSQPDLAAATEIGTEKVAPTELAACQEQLANLQHQLQLAAEKEKRFLADYQNLIRRTQEERIKMIKFANQDLLLSLLPVLDNLSRAADHLTDQGLNLVMTQLWQTLAELGLTQLNVLGQAFDVNTMEVVEKKKNGQKVISVIQPGYDYQGQVLQHAKVGLD